MAVQIVKPVETELPINPLTVEAGTENEDQFTWVSLLCCTYASPYSYRYRSMIWKKISTYVRGIYPMGQGVLTGGDQRMYNIFHLPLLIHISVLILHGERQ